MWLFPRVPYVIPRRRWSWQLKHSEELKEQVAWFKSEDKLLEAQRILERTNFDVEMMRETGFCSGIENYSPPPDGLCTGGAALHPHRLFPGGFPLL